MDEDFAVSGESEADAERLLESDHVLVQVHLRPRAGKCFYHSDPRPRNRPCPAAQGQCPEVEGSGHGRGGRGAGREEGLRR